MDNAVRACDGRKEEDQAILRRVSAGMSLLADISRADVFLLCAGCDRQVCVVAQAAPHSVPAIHSRERVGEVWRPDEDPAVGWILQGRTAGRVQTTTPEGAILVEESFPIRNQAGQVIAALLIQKTLIEHERDRRRNEYFRMARDCLREMVVDGQMPDASHLTPFDDHDGLVFVDGQQRILYVSHIASNLYSKLGYIRSLVGLRLEDLETHDASLVSRAMGQDACLEEEAEEGQRIWIKKAIPLKSRRPIGDGLWGRIRPAARQPSLVGAFLAIHDATDARRKEQELKLKSAMLQEIQHRVRNSLQTLIALLRMEARRASTEEARKVLNESISRILSVAAVHDSLVQLDADVVNLRALSEYILNQTKISVVDRSQQIVLSLDGPDIELPAEQATPCALVINELVLNALEHGGYGAGTAGRVGVTLCDGGDQVAIEIHNDGQELPEGFDVQTSGQLGLRLVQTLVEDGLGGKFELSNRNGVSAIVQFPKRPFNGR